MLWKSWDKLCLPKNYGVLGFRNLKMFNLALLALHDFNTLLGRVFKV